MPSSDYVQIRIPRDLYERFDRSPMRIRDTLWRVSEDEAKQDLNRVQQARRGTVITTKYRTTCPICNEHVEKGIQARMIDWEASESGSACVHEGCAESYFRGAALRAV